VQELISGGQFFGRQFVIFDGLKGDKSNQGRPYLPCKYLKDIKEPYQVLSPKRQPFSLFAIARNILKDRSSGTILARSL
jgi:hypothetical protein